MNGLILSKQPFAQAPQLTSINPQALPSAFYQTNRSVHDDWSSHKHFLQPAVFCDYGPFPFTTLGTGTPSVFYRPQDAQFVYTYFGDDTGEAYLKSIWQFMEELGLNDKATSISQHITRGGWGVMKRVIDLMNNNSNNNDGGDDDDNNNNSNNQQQQQQLDKEKGKEKVINIGNDENIQTEFNDLDIEKILNELQNKKQSHSQQQQPSIHPSSNNNNDNNNNAIATPLTTHSTPITENTAPSTTSYS